MPWLTAHSNSRLMWGDALAWAEKTNTTRRLDEMLSTIAWP